MNEMMMEMLVEKHFAILSACCITRARSEERSAFAILATTIIARTC